MLFVSTGINLVKRCWIGQSWNASSTSTTAVSILYFPAGITVFTPWINKPTYNIYNLYQLIKNGYTISECQMSIDLPFTFSNKAVFLTWLRDMTTAARSVTQVPAALDSRRHHDVVLLEEPWQGNLSIGLLQTSKQLEEKHAYTINTPRSHVMGKNERFESGKVIHPKRSKLTL